LRSTSTEDYQFLLSDAAEIVQQINKERIASDEIPPKCVALESILKETSRDPSLIICQNDGAKKLVEKICKYGAKGIDHKDQLEVVEEELIGPIVQVVTFREFEYTNLDTFKAIIIYDICLSAVRTIELFLAESSKDRVLPDIYHIVYADSFEEQKYLREIREEKIAFERLIAKKSTIVFPDILLQKKEEEKNEASKKDLESELMGNLDERGLKTGSAAPKQAIVDMRELKSHLPFILHRNGFVIDPQTITVGDYILSNMIAIERKSVADFVQSLENGRLADQAGALTATFQRAALLIEFERGRPFQLQTTHYLKSGVISVTEVSSRLVLLLLHHPRLRILWSSSPLTTLHIFSDLISSIELEDNNFFQSQSKNKSSINRSAKDALLALPGVTEKNVLVLMRDFESLRSILVASKRDLERSIGPESSTLLYDFLQSSK
jgi:DNA excision repair protein ERCC-4